MKLLEIKQKKKYALLITEENQTILTDPAYPGNQGFALEEEIDTEQCLRDNADFACTYGFRCGADVSFRNAQAQSIKSKNIWKKNI
jgi:hypothetical protein